MHALDADSLRDPSVTFWSAWVDGTIAGIGALKALDAERGELKSMRVADALPRDRASAARCFGTSSPRPAIAA